MGRIIIPSEAYGKFRDDAVYQIARQWSGEPAAGRLLLQLVVVQKGKIRIDYDSALSSFFDVLQDAKVIGNDNDIAWVFGGKVPGGKEWSAELKLYRDTLGGDLFGSADELRLL